VCAAPHTDLPAGDSFGPHALKDLARAHIQKLHVCFGMRLFVTCNKNRAADLVRAVCRSKRREVERPDGLQEKASSADGDCEK